MLSITTIDNEIINVEDWKSIKKPILRMSFQINEKQAVVLEGFEEYIKLKEHFKGVNSPIKGISKILLVGKYNGKVAIITIDIIKNRILKSVVSANQAYQSKPIISEHWKKGVISKNPHITIENI